MTSSSYQKVVEVHVKRSVKMGEAKSGVLEGWRHPEEAKS